MKRIMSILFSFAIMTGVLLLGCRAADYDTVENMVTKQGYYTDSDGYIYEITVTMTPWILYSPNEELLHAIWTDLGNGNTLPTPNDWGFTLNDNYYELWVPYLFRFRASNFDMYYTLGNLSIRNVTDGFDITSNNARDLYVRFESGSFWYNERSSVIGQIYYSNSTKKITPGTNTVSHQHIMEISTVVRSNNVGPIPFVFAHGESSTPADGMLGFKQLEESGSIRIHCNDSGERINFNINNPLYDMTLDVIKDKLQYETTLQDSDEMVSTEQEWEDEIDTSGTTSRDSGHFPVVPASVLIMLVIIIVFVLIYQRNKKRVHKKSSPAHNQKQPDLTIQKSFDGNTDRQIPEQRALPLLRMRIVCLDKTAICEKCKSIAPVYQVTVSQGERSKTSDLCSGCTNRLKQRVDTENSRYQNNTP